MTKIMLVDDFQLDRDAIAELLRSYHDLPIEIIAQSDNGEDALEILRQAQPDIIICDVEMPFMNGLQFATHARKVLPAVHFIFCSLYERFTYVQEAVSLGSDAYILKPVNAQELHDQLQRTISKQNDQKLIRQEFERLTEFVRHNREMLTDLFFTDILFGRMTAEELEEKSVTLDYTVRNRRYSLAVLEIDDFRETAHQTEFGSTTLLTLMTERVLRYYVSELSEHVRTIRIDDTRYGIICESDSVIECGDQFNRVLSICEEIQNKLRSNNIGTTIALANRTVDILGLIKSYEQCQYLLEFKIMLGKGRIITPEEVFIPTNVPGPDINSMMKKIRMLLNTGSTQEINDYVDTCFTEGFEYAGPDYPRIMSYCLIICLQLALNEQNERLSVTGLDEISIWKKLNRFETVSDVCSLFRDLLIRYANILQQKREREKSGFIERVCRFIDDSINLDISLEDIARQFFYSPNYLNHIFKESTGYTIAEYLTECRMKRAGEMLMMKDKKINDISANLGYRSASYFSVMFKNYYGISPREYRMKRMAENEEP